jgi:hypothetical protein
MFPSSLTGDLAALALHKGLHGQNRVCFIIAFASLPPDLQELFSSHGEFLVVKQWRRKENSYNFTLDWTKPRRQFARTLQRNQAIELISHCFKAKAEQFHKRIDNPSWVQCWSKGWRCFATQSPEFFTALYRCNALQQNLLYLGIALQCDMPLLEAIWLSKPAFHVIV